MKASLAQMDESQRESEKEKDRYGKEGGSVTEKWGSKLHYACGAKYTR